MGYVTGTYDTELNAYLVTEAEAHSWPEIYFPEYGWVEFEPTSGRPSRLDVAATLDLDASFFDSPADSLGQDIADAPFNLSAASRRILESASLIVLALLVVVGLALQFVRSRRMRHESVQLVTGKAYESLVSASGALDISYPQGMTPYELADTLSARVGSVSGGGPWKRMVRPASNEIRKLAEFYVTASYSPAALDPALKPEVLSTWRRLRWRLWLGRLGTKLRFF